ncbi:unnamed protein product [Polarella glacialis]|uniref:Uncharacterized protein n=1 Tax=Polarella glacialis TaxID=89957 RepID=A0A813HCT7_POLGL|nr:unnamed protein product [Polarella glacialis]
MWVTLGVVCCDNLEALATERCIAFEAEFVSHIPSARLADIDISQIEVLSHLEYTKGCEMRTWAVRPEPLREFLASLPPKKERDSARTGPRAATASRAAMGELPAWARDRLNKSATNRPAPDSQIAEPSEGSDQDEQQPFDEDQVEALFEELELRRADYGAAQHPRHEDFRVVLFTTKEGMGFNGKSGLQRHMLRRPCCGVLSEAVCESEFTFPPLCVHRGRLWGAGKDLVPSDAILPEPHTVGGQRLQV